MAGTRRGRANRWAMANTSRAFVRTVQSLAAPALVLLLFASQTAWAEEKSADVATCTLEPGPIHTVTRVIDAETVTLDDGSEVRLIGALSPRARDGDATEGAWPAENEAMAALNSLVLGHTVKLAFGGQRSDRYGRTLAHLFTDKDGENIWVQGELLRSGHARAYGLFGSYDCGPELLAHEKIARDGHVGLWALSLYRPKPATEAGLLMHVRSQFHIVTGKVRNVSRTKSAVYLNFGDDWKTDFTARIGKATLSKNSQWAAALEALQGQDISVRGWIERRNGPLIDVVDISQIESVTPTAKAEPVQPETPATAPETTSAPPDATAQPSAPKFKQKRPEPRVPGAVNL